MKPGMQMQNGTAPGAGAQFTFNSYYQVEVARQLYALSLIRVPGCSPVE